MPGVTKVPDFACCIWKKGVSLLESISFQVKVGRFPEMDISSLWSASLGRHFPYHFRGCGGQVYSRSTTRASSLWWLSIAIHCLFVMSVTIYFWEVIAMHCQERQGRLSLSWRKFSIFVSNEHCLRYGLCTSKGPLHINHLFQEHWWRSPLFVVVWKLSERIIVTSTTTAPSLSAPLYCLY